MAHLLWLLAVPWFFAADIIVLKNGKRIPCDRYTSDDQRTTVFRGEKAFSIPTHIIDWQRSKEATAAAQKPKGTPEVSKVKAKPKPKRLEANPPREPIVLTNKDVKSWRRSSKRGPVVINFKKIANSIIVNVKINQSQPYQLVLDTGASITLIDPKVLEDLDIPLGENNGSVVGVSGQVIQAHSSVLEELSLQGATVRNLEVMARRIPQLAAMNVVGLLGQDFLNHFIVELDASRNVLTLTPQGTGEQAVNSTRREQVVDPNAQYQRLFSLINELVSHYQHIRRGNHRDNPNGTELGKIQRELGEINASLRIYEQTVRDLDPATLLDQGKETRSRVLRCAPLVNRVALDAQQFSRQLRRSSTGNNRNLDQLAEHHDRLRQIVQEATNCR